MNPNIGYMKPNTSGLQFLHLQKALLCITHKNQLLLFFIINAIWYSILLWAIIINDCELDYLCLILLFQKPSSSLGMFMMLFKMYLIDCLLLQLFQFSLKCFEWIWSWQQGLSPQWIFNPGLDFPIKIHQIDRNWFFIFATSYTHSILPILSLVGVAKPLQ